eukprot:TRINITY_DN1501_c0_g1_i1.p1 TRINITY_DN1501_c0_g1~~TRINITY_DN1501_c0_g1_i1.p1  ORF type:complete len:166 (+),score=44.79 TRINITY_DN1501_c0_g1_i1:210-707(+)
MSLAKKPWKIVLIVVAIILIAIGVTVAFVYPRNPTIYDPVVDYKSYVLANSSLTITVSATMAIDNPNFYPIVIESIALGVKYEGSSIATANIGELRFNSRSNTTQTRDVSITTTDQTTIQSIGLKIKTGQTIDMSFSGPAKIKVLSVHLDKDISFSKSFVIPNNS